MARRRLAWLPVLALAALAASVPVSYLAEPLTLPTLGAAITFAILSLRES